ncbi:MAG: fibrobacter succinogenes major paralogous domain-containing protein [Pseudomonadota bacterium]
MLILGGVVAVLFLLPAFAERVEGQVLSNPVCADSVVDIDGHQYRGIQIGDQCWLDSNLKVLRYRDGTPISGALFFDLTGHGGLYRFTHVTHPSGICPSGWKVPSDAEFMQLEIAVGMSAGQAQASGWRGEQGDSRVLKIYDTAYRWTDLERSRVNASGFSFTPSGAGFNGRISGENRFGDLWTSTEHSAELAWYRSVFWISVTSPFRGDVHKVRRDPVAKEWAFSVRCVKSAPVTSFSDGNSPVWVKRFQTQEGINYG